MTNLVGEKVIVTMPSGTTHLGFVVQDPAMVENEYGEKIPDPGRVKVSYAGGYCSPHRERVQVV